MSLPAWFGVPFGGFGNTAFIESLFGAFGGFEGLRPGKRQA